MNGKPSVIYEDETILVLDKPAGMVVNVSDTTVKGETLQEWIEKQFSIFPAEQDLASRDNFSKHEESDFYKRAGIVHRLDKETSGVIVVAKTEDAFTNLQKQFKQRQVKKTYLALVHGNVEEARGEIKVPVGRLPWNRTHFGVVAGGKEASTEYKVLQVKYRGIGKKREVLTYLELYPRTGRTHQIRVHLKHIGHPIVSDSLYAGRKTSRGDRRELGRLFLHASTIQFIHPTTRSEVVFSSLLPQELQVYLDKLA